MSATMEGMDAFETRFIATEAELSELMQPQHTLVVELLSFDAASGERLIGGAEVPLVVLQGEMWVEGTAAVQAHGHDGESCSCCRGPVHSPRHAKCCNSF
jgi:hypothetical protein